MLQSELQGYFSPHDIQQHNVRGRVIFTQKNILWERIAEMRFHCPFLSAPSTNVMTAHNSSLDSAELNTTCRRAADTKSRLIGRGTHARLCRQGVNWVHNTGTIIQECDCSTVILVWLLIFQKRTEWNRWLDFYTKRRTKLLLLHCHYALLWAVY